jgi:hypothetical protein
MVVTKINEQPMTLTTTIVLFCAKMLTMAIVSQGKVAKEKRKESCQFVKDLEKNLL